MKSFRHVWSLMTKLWEFLYRCPGATRRLPCCLLEQRYVTSRGLYVEELRHTDVLCVQVLLETGIQKVSRTQPGTLWGRSPSFSFWLAICWVSLGFAAGSYKTCGHAADQSQSCGFPAAMYPARHVPGRHVPWVGCHVPRTQLPCPTDSAAMSHGPGCHMSPYPDKFPWRPIPARKGCFISQTDSCF